MSKTRCLSTNFKSVIIFTLHLHKVKQVQQQWSSGGGGGNTSRKHRCGSSNKDKDVKKMRADDSHGNPNIHGRGQQQHDQGDEGCCHWAHPNPRPPPRTRATMLDPPELSRSVFFGTLRLGMPPLRPEPLTDCWMPRPRRLPVAVLVMMRQNADAEVGPSPSSSSKSSGNAGMGRHAGGRTGTLLVQLVSLHRFPRLDKTHHDDDKRSSRTRK